MILRNIIFISIFALFLAPSFSVAEEKAVAGDATNLGKAQTKAMQGQVSSLLTTLDQQEAQHFMTLYANYNLYSMVKAVSEDVGRAVDKCADNNKDMADDLNDRFSKWDASVGKSMKEAMSNIKNMSLAQTYVSQSELKMLFGLVDEVRSVNSSRFETTPVTTPEACEFMMSKMDETQENMNRLLAASLMSYPDLSRKNQK